MKTYSKLLSLSAFVVMLFSLNKLEAQSSGFHLIKKTVVGVIETAFELVVEIMKDKNIKEKNFIYFNRNLKFLKISKIFLIEYPILILSSILGMLVMISSNDLMLFYIGLELQSLALYVLASFNSLIYSASNSV